MKIDNNVKNRFWKKVVVLDGNACWEWSASLDGKGYGQINIGGRPKRAHRVSWEIHFGQIVSSSIFVCHDCDNRKCVNPNHLFLGSNQENLRDASNKGRTSRGEGRWSSKLTEDDVLLIRRENPDTVSERILLAKRFGVSYHTIWRVLSRRTWRHI